jgi:hypothetical protein
VQVRIALDVASLAVSAASVGSPGGLLLVTNIFANVGLDPLPKFSRGLYLSSDTNITTADWRIDDFGISVGLGLGQRFTNAFDHGIPVDVPPGIYYIGFITDGEDALPELDESNNAVAGNPVEVRDPNHITTQVRLTGTNVVVSFVTAPGRAYALERTASLVAPTVWTTVAGAGGILGTGYAVLVPDPAGMASGQRFYRVRLWP